MRILNRTLQRSGGWVYHRRYFFNKKMWRSFKMSLCVWLTENINSKDKLLLIGPSAGYNLDDQFLSKFNTLTALDIDPLAPIIWPRIHKLSAPVWSNKNFFGDRKTLDPLCFTQIRNSHPDHHLLFCNLLGQLAFLYQMDSELALRLRRELSKLRSPWTSFHDLYSVHGPSKNITAFANDFNSPQSRTEVLSYFNNWPGQFEIIDHWTGEIIPEQKNAKYFLWRFSKNSIHIIEAVSHS